MKRRDFMKGSVVALSGSLSPSMKLLGASRCRQPDLLRVQLEMNPCPIPAVRFDSTVVIS